MTNEIISTIEHLTAVHGGSYNIKIDGEDVIWVYGSQKDFVEDINGHSAEVVKVSVEVKDALDYHGWIGEEGPSAISEAESLEDLMTIFYAEAHFGIEIIDNREMTDLPVFAARTSPKGDLEEVWSWDDTHAIVGSCAGDMRIVRYVNGGHILDAIVDAYDGGDILEVTPEYVEEYIDGAWDACVSMREAEAVANAFDAWQSLRESGEATANEWYHICESLNFSVFA